MTKKGIYWGANAGLNTEITATGECVWAKPLNKYKDQGQDPWTLGKYKNVNYWGTTIGGSAGEAGYAPSSAYFARAPNNISLMAQWSTGWINPC